MATDKKISELPVLQGIGADDVSVLVNNGVDYQFSISLLLQYISSNLNSGASVSFGALLPQNNAGKNGDVFMNTATGSFAQKTSGVWLIVYNPPDATLTGNNTLLYGLGKPNVNTGIDNDSYIDTGTGIFYRKQAGTWEQVFSMQTGPQGQKGDKGDTGITGEAGKSILNGTSNPSNQNTGTDGDFYLNTDTLKLFGPKKAGLWDTGIYIGDTAPTPYAYQFLAGGVNPLIINNWQTAFYRDYNNGEFLVQVIDEDGNLQDRPDISVKRIIDRSSALAVQTGVSIDFPAYPNGQVIIKYANIPIL